MVILEYVQYFGERTLNAAIIIVLLQTRLLMQTSTVDMHILTQIIHTDTNTYV